MLPLVREACGLGILVSLNSDRIFCICATILGLLSGAFLGQKLALSPLW
ncbi:MAG: hypothetical protein ACK5M4_01930 [Pseudorhodobacter sp.]